MTYPIGSTVWGDRLIRCEVLKVQSNKSTGEVRYRVRCPSGDRFITPDQITGFEPPERRVMVRASKSSYFRCTGVVKDECVMFGREVVSVLLDGYGLPWREFNPWELRDIPEGETPISLEP